MTTETFTELLRAYNRGDEAASRRLFALVYDELKRVAHGALAGLRFGATLDTTALVHEAYLKFAASEPKAAEDRAHFYAVAASVMRGIIIDYARHRRALKRGGGARETTLEGNDLAVRQHVIDLIAIDETLGRLSAFDERLTQVVECRFFAGYTEEETATALGVSLRTVQRDWSRARAWLAEYARAARGAQEDDAN